MQDGEEKRALEPALRIPAWRQSFEPATQQSLTGVIAKIGLDRSPKEQPNIVGDRSGIRVGRESKLVAGVSGNPGNRLKNAQCRSQPTPVAPKTCRERPGSGRALQYQGIEKSQRPAVIDDRHSHVAVRVILAVCVVVLCGRHRHREHRFRVWPALLEFSD
jgi:hypothetical protein